MKRTTPIMQRILSRVEVDTTTGCWRWPGAIDSYGYGVIQRGRAGEGKTLVHLVSWEFYNGPVPSGLQIDHVRARGCIHRDCSNPDHLEAVTPAVNSQRRPNTRLTPEIVARIRSDPRSQVAIARELRVDPSLISHVRSGRRWKEQPV